MNPTSKKEDITEKPKQKAGDVVHTMTKVGLSMVPVVGGAAKEIFAAIVTPPLAKRRDEWIESIGNGLKKLEDKTEDLGIENLSKNEDFITTVTYATTIALRNHEKEKISALRNAVLNAALPTAPEGDLQLFYLSLLDILTPLHIRTLAFFDNPEKWIQEHESKKYKELKEFLELRRTGRKPPKPLVKPEKVKTMFHAITTFVLPMDDHVFIQIVRDLSGHGLINISSNLSELAATVEFDLVRVFARLPSWTTNLGRQIIRFISSPIETDA